jgi:glycosyltransferase involved in cell wall biosynthesis
MTSPEMPVVVNTRVLGAALTGTPRYVKELLARWNGRAETVSPGSCAHGVSGHAWEQLVLPGRLRGRLLFSPSNTGPLIVQNQVVTIHDMAVFDCDATFSPQFEAWYKILLPQLAHRARQLITVSAFVKERILAHTNVSPAKITVIPNGVSPRFSPAAVSELDATVAVLSLPSREYILAVGSADPRKNLTRLFQAWTRVQSRVSEDIWLVVVGAGNSRVFRGTYPESLPERVFLLGHVEDHILPTLYAGALAMTYVSIYEGFGLPPLEAMASGTAVLAGNRSSLPEVVGDAGLLVDPFDVGAIEEGIRRILEDSELRSDLRQRGIVRAEQFCWDEAARRTWDVLQAAAAAN